VKATAIAWAWTGAYSVAAVIALVALSRRVPAPFNRDVGLAAGRAGAGTVVLAIVAAVLAAAIGSATANRALLATAIAALVAEIGSEPDKEAETESATHAGTIRCVVGRSELDFAAATLLAHLLSRKGCRAEVVASPTVSRGNIGNFGTEGVSALVVCYVDYAGAIAPLRFLLRRLRQRLPEAQLFVAVWPQDHSLLQDHDLQSGVGVTCATSLRQAVSLCLATDGNTPSERSKTGQVIALAKR